MSSILIKNIEMPKERESFTVTIKYNGLVFDTETGIQVAEAQEIPPHGKLGDLNELYEKFARLENEAMNALKTTTTGSVNWIKWSAILTERTGYKYDIADAPTIIEADCLPVLHGTFTATSEQEAIRRLTGEDET